MATSPDRNILLQELSNLLGFEDGASDVLEHLLTIESSEVGSLHFLSDACLVV